jgi:multiple sugar transport system ATP-binding protein
LPSPEASRADAEFLEQEKVMAQVTLERVTKVFEGRTVVDDLNIEVEDGEFLAVVGPSGCGKTTTLRMLAGFEKASSGIIRIGNKVVNAIAPSDRNVSMVFQTYALFPHMTIEKNLLFGLRTRGESRAQAKKEVAEVAGVLGIDPLLGQKPGQLSGGERQRVALGRALLRRPDVFLLDEPLSNLDAALRTQMRFELKRIHAQFPITTIYVTHDQVEAMTMADRIAVMRSGCLQQLERPVAMYQNPGNAFVAGFIGSPKMNLLAAKVTAESGTLHIEVLGVTFDKKMTDPTVTFNFAGECTVGFRPEDVRVTDRPDGTLPRLRGRVESVEPLGADTFIAVRVHDEIIRCRCAPSLEVSVDDDVWLEIEIDKVHVFDGDGVVVGSEI